MSLQFDQDPTQDKNLLESIVDASGKFNQLCLDRHATGASEYGPNTFLSRTYEELITMLEEELADVANYSRYLFIKMEMVRLALRESNLLNATDGQFIPSYPNQS